MNDYLDNSFSFDATAALPEAVGTPQTVTNTIETIPDDLLGSSLEQRVEHFRPSLRDIIAQDASRVVFAASVTSQPHYGLIEPLSVNWQAARASEARALPLAGKDDVVVTAGRFDPGYLTWLRSLGLGPGEVIEFNSAATTSAAALLRNDFQMQSISAAESVVLAPYYSGAEERSVADELGMEFFGCDPAVAEKYFNKGRFKEMCSSLGVPMVEGLSCDSAPEKLEAIVSRLLKSYPTILLRGTEGANGSSIAKIESADDGPAKIRELCLSGAKEVLVEPFLNVIASPNDQWVISIDGSLIHLGTSIQIFRDLKHHGNESGGYLKRSSCEYIRSVSETIVNKMRDDGYRGIVGVDYIISERDEIYPIENNPRLNGSTFVYGILDRVREEFPSMEPTETSCWKFYRALEMPTTFTGLQEKYGDLFLRKGITNGIFPFDCETLSINGKWTPVIFADDRYHLERLERELELRGSGRI